jgi:DNA-directed RNA polymerase alpha subunit
MISELELEFVLEEIALLKTICYAAMGAQTPYEPFRDDRYVKEWKMIQLIEKCRDKIQNEPFERTVNILDKSVEDLPFNGRCLSILSRSTIRTVRDLITNSKSDMLKYECCGKVSVNEMVEILKQYGLSFGMKLPEINEKGK